MSTIRTTPTPTPTPTPSRAARRGVVALAVAALVLSGAACSGRVVHTYKSFASALERGASCPELIDQRNRFDRAETLAKVDADLQRIGCTSRDAKRTDRS
jgi:hypothetical protein